MIDITLVPHENGTTLRADTDAGRDWIVGMFHEMADPILDDTGLEIAMKMLGKTDLLVDWPESMDNPLDTGLAVYESAAKDLGWDLGGHSLVDLLLDQDVCKTPEEARALAPRLQTIARVKRERGDYETGSLVRSVTEATQVQAAGMFKIEETDRSARALANRFVEGTMTVDDWKAILKSSVLTVETYVQLQNKRRMPPGRGRADFVAACRDANEGKIVVSLEHRS